jgi:chemotaxis methyl-accepting protein methylase/signal transduction histidine kinase/chemotaxis response regulator CheB
MRKRKKNRSDQLGEPSKTGNGRDERGVPGSGAFLIVGIGASAGGLEAFTQLLHALPPDTGMGFVLVQHLDPDHESALVQILSRTTPLPVREIANDEPVEPDHVYVIPRDANLTIAGGVLKIEPRQRTRTRLRPIDAFFESLAQDQRERAVGVVLSGTANDGTLGLEAIKAEGGITLVQNETAKHDSMPRSAVAAGCVDLVLSPADIAKELARIARHPYVAGQPLVLPADRDGSPEDDRASATAHQGDRTPLPSGRTGTPATDARRARAEAEAKSDGGPEEAAANRQRGRGSGAQTRPAGGVDGYKKILLLLRNHSGVDFSLYRSNTIQRRVTRRVVLSKQSTLEDYAAYLRGNTKELDTLYSDVLISVTSFFRNPEMFEVLEQNVLPRLLEQRGDEPLRCWVLGCSTGQEAYSIAMTFAEVAENGPRARKLQIFATDLNHTLLDKARQGLYAKTLAEDISPQRLRRFFVEEDGGYRVTRPLREMVVFARQNLIADPPFSRMDLISCRNLLIYFDQSLQNKAIPTFHYALKPGGFLLLGASESIGGFTDLFEAVDKKHKIYAKKPAPVAKVALPLKADQGEEPPRWHPLFPAAAPAAADLTDAGRELNAQREADRITVNQLAPPGVLVNADLQVLQFRGPTGAFLEPPVGKASFDVLKMAREGLPLPLRGLINKAKKDNEAARKDGVRVKRNGKLRAVNLQVIPLKNLRERCYLILFEEEVKPVPGGGVTSGKPSRRRPADRAAFTRVAELESELAEMREYLHSMQEQHEAANEEVQSANEEVQSANEELQSLNEELETSKEELESANEELTTVNEEMSNRNALVEKTNVELRETEAQLRRYGADLADAAARRIEFLAMLGHELRNPVSALTNGLARLGSLMDNHTRSEEVRAILVRQTQRIASLLDQLLDITRVTLGKVALSKGRVDLVEVIREVVDTVRPLVDAHKHELTLSLHPDVEVLVAGDAVRLAQVVENLLTNAAKYTNNGGRIELSIESEGDEARIVVTDNGIGMSADLLPHVFEVFSQAPRALDRAKGGMGLGLALVQGLVAMHGGRVTASSPGLGQGSRFVVALPRLRETDASDSGEREAARTVRDSAGPQPRRILLVDDELDTAQTLAELLELEGHHQTLVVGDGPAALKVVDAFDPEVVLLDLGLPEMDGYELARRLRAEHRRKQILLIAISGYSKDWGRLEQAGFDDHLLKPAGSAEVLALLAAWERGAAGGAPPDKQSS